jgi:hypothetical protein
MFWSVSILFSGESPVMRVHPNAFQQLGLIETDENEFVPQGTPFCRSAMSGFKLVVQNIGRLAFTTIMANILILLGKVEIALVSALSCALVLWQRQETGRGLVEWAVDGTEAYLDRLIDTDGSGSDNGETTTTCHRHHHHILFVSS